MGKKRTEMNTIETGVSRMVCFLFDSEKEILNSLA